MASFLRIPAKISPIPARRPESPPNFSCSGRVRVSAKVKDLETRVPKLGNDVRFYGQFSLPVKESKDEKERRNYYVNSGDAIRTLREEFPDLFYRELSFGIYRFGFSSSFYSSVLCF